MINVFTSAAPGQTECDNAIRAIQSSRHVLENANQSISDLSYYECLDTVMEKSKALGDGMTGNAMIISCFRKSLCEVILYLFFSI